MDEATFFALLQQYPPLPGPQNPADADMYEDSAAESHSGLAPRDPVDVVLVGVHPAPACRLRFPFLASATIAEVQAYFELAVAEPVQRQQMFCNGVLLHKHQQLRHITREQLVLIHVTRRRGPPVSAMDLVPGMLSAYCKLMYGKGDGERISKIVVEQLSRM